MKRTKYMLTTSYALSFAVLLSCGQGGQNREAQVTDEQALAEASEEAVNYAVSTGESVVKWVGRKNIGAGQHSGSFRLKSGSFSVEEGNITSGSFNVDVTSLTVEDPPADSEDNAKLVTHLHSEDFFHSAEFPEAMFEVTSVSPVGSDVAADEGEEEAEVAGDDAAEDVAAEDTSDEAVAEEGEEDVVEASEVRGESIDSPTHHISGNLTLRGQTKNITFPAQVSMEEGTFTAEAKFSINRTDFGVEYNNESIKGVAAEMIIKDYVDIHLQIKAQREVSSEEEEGGSETQEVTTSTGDDAAAQ